MDLTLTLPVPPSSNRYWRIWRGKAVKTAEARAYRDRVAVLAHQQGVHGLLRGPVAVTVRWFRAAHMGDLDNRLKVALDSLNGVAWADDRQIVELHAYRAEDKAHARLEVTVTEVAA